MLVVKLERVLELLELLELLKLENKVLTVLVSLKDETVIDILITPLPFISLYYTIFLFLFLRMDTQ
jgi:hypothetical protein